jgi:hypothetical protein
MLILRKIQISGCIITVNIFNNKLDLLERTKLEMNNEDIMRKLQNLIILQ